MDISEEYITNKVIDDVVWIDDNTWFLLSEIKETGMTDWMKTYYLTRKNTLIVAEIIMASGVMTWDDIRSKYMFSIASEYENYKYQKFLNNDDKLNNLPSEIKEV